jgi:regulator of cell morphogenesis and NO signaling
MKITKEKTVAEVVTENMGADHVFSKYKIDFCCEGGMSLEEACKKSNVEFETVKLEIENIKNIIVGELDFAEMDLMGAIEHTTNIHHKYLNESIAELAPLTAKVAHVHGQDHKEVIEINMLFSKIVSELSEQIALEKNVLFPFVSKFLGQEKSKTENDAKISNILEQSVKNIEEAFVLAGDAFKSISKLSSNYTVPEEACNSYRFLYEKLEEFEHELHKYIHFEKNILFPKLLKLV